MSGFFTLFYYFGPKLDKESKRYVDETIPVIIIRWNSDELITHLHQELLEEDSPEKIKTLFNLYSELLGNLEEYKDSKGEANIYLWVPINVTAEYTIEADFEKAPAKIIVELLKQNNKWQITKFTVRSEVFMPKDFILPPEVEVK